MFRMHKGFTLIELMVAVAIIGILSAIAVPSYMDSVTKSRRKDAEGALEGFANAMERHFTDVNNYCNVGGTGGANTCGDTDTTNDTGSPPLSFYPAKSPIDGNQVYYNLTISAVTPSTYILLATPTGAQTGNGALQLDNTGARFWDKNNDGTFDTTTEKTWE
ncbi:general secretion pathway protein H [Methyloglobulus morosus KoM1]|uniref:General secretion pathway protein H n=1 Tax=Methyloglobulus morosus KoM1 TaxID=1116472 RepID=V5E3C3_9GAMM|nr:type IV pilin protein [Methyloglobulus morosus]ESS74051.1 general secretion pathway protein H [Methyloglobulus morosus KoM1]